MAKIVARLHSPERIRDFFAWSSWLDQITLRPLSHIAPYWEATWDDETQRYIPEPRSFADDLNTVIELIATCPRPPKYHDHEDVIAKRVQDAGWPIQKKGSRWVGADYPGVLEQGAFRDVGQRDLVAAATGRVHAALDYGQTHFDEMEEGHLNMLAAIISIIIYHRYCDGTSLLVEETDEA
jgi:hypothetical protein